MRWLDKLLLRLRTLLRRERIEHELDAELRFHLEQLIEENLAAGMTPEEARYAARRAIGGAEQIKDECRDMRRVNAIVSLFEDLRYAARLFRRSRFFTVIARSVMGSGVRLIGMGLMFGLAGACVLTRLIRSLLYGVAAADPVTFVGSRSSLLFLLIGLGACYFPARRAARVDPTVALRYE